MRGRRSSSCASLAATASSASARPPRSAAWPTAIRARKASRARSTPTSRRCCRPGCDNATPPCSAWPVGPGQSFAKSAVETALLDAQGQRLGLPVHALLGGAVRNALPVLWTLASGDAARDIDEAQRADRGPAPPGLQAEDRRRELARGHRSRQAIRARPGRRRDADGRRQPGVGRADRGARHRGARSRGRRASSSSPWRAAIAARWRAWRERFDVAIMADEAVHDARRRLRPGEPTPPPMSTRSRSRRPAACGRRCAPRPWPTPRASASTAARCSKAASAASPRRTRSPPARTLALGTELFGPLLLKDDVVRRSAPTYRDFELQLPQAPGLGVQLDAGQARLLPARPRHRGPSPSLPEDRHALPCPDDRAPAARHAACASR